MAKKLPPVSFAEQAEVDKYSLAHPHFVTAYGPKRKVVQDPGGASMTKQSFKDECDVNVIMRRYEQGGVLPELREELVYGDATGGDYHEAMNLVAEARSRFEALPARAREFFKNDPGAFLAYMEDKPELEELGELGLLSREAVERLRASKVVAGSPGEGVPAPEAPKAPEVPAPPKNPPVAA